MFKFIARIIWKIKNRKLLKELCRDVIFMKYQESNPRINVLYSDYIKEHFN